MAFCCDSYYCTLTSACQRVAQWPAAVPRSAFLQHQPAQYEGTGARYYQVWQVEALFNAMALCANAT